MSTTPGRDIADPTAGERPPAQGERPAAQGERLLGIGAAAARAGVSERALRYYQQLGLITPCGSTPGGMRRYSEDDLARVARIRQLQVLLGFNLDEDSVVLPHQDRMAEIKRTYLHENTSDAERRRRGPEGLQPQHRHPSPLVAQPA